MESPDQGPDDPAVQPSGARASSFGGGPILLGKLVAAAGVLALLVALFAPEGPVKQAAGFAGLALITLGVAGYWFGRFILAANRSPRDDEQQAQRDSMLCSGRCIAGGVPVRTARQRLRGGHCEYPDHLRMNAFVVKFFRRHLQEGRQG